MKISTELRNSLGFRSINYSDVYSQERIQLNFGENIYMEHKSKVNNSAYVSLYDLGENKPSDRVMAMMIDTFIGQPYSMELRTNQQLGYIVAGGAYSRDDYSGMYFIIQSDGYPANVVEDRSLMFLSNISNLLEKITFQEFNTYKQAVREKINEKSTSIAEEANYRFNNIFNMNNNSQRDEESIKALDEITLDEMKEKILSSLDRSKSKSITVLLYADQHEQKTSDKTTFDNLKEWKQKRLFK